MYKKSEKLVVKGFVSVSGWARSIGYCSKDLPLGEQLFDEDYPGDACTFVFEVNGPQKPWGLELEESLAAANPPRFFL